jgi:hypothetical protein
MFVVRDFEVLSPEECSQKRFQYREIFWNQIGVWVVDNGEGLVVLGGPSVDKMVKLGEMDKGVIRL